jgi:predicted  nucleic acid-binding Zn-ribbon protein
MIDSKVFAVYGEYGAVGIIVVLFAMMIINLIKSQKAQNEDLDSIRQSIAKAETKMGNVESIILKMLDRWNRSDETSSRHRQDIVKELNDVTDDLAYLKGRINGKGL